MRSGEIRWDQVRSGEKTQGQRWSWGGPGWAWENHHFRWARNTISVELRSWKLGRFFSIFDCLSDGSLKTRSNMVKNMVYDEFYEKNMQNIKIYKNIFFFWLAREPGSRHWAREPGRTGKYRKKLKTNKKKFWPARPAGPEYGPGSRFHMGG